SGGGRGAGGSAVRVAVTGSVPGAPVQWNGAARTTTVVSSAQVTAAIPATDIATAGTAQVTVVNPGAVASNALPFTVTNPPPPPASVAPRLRTDGGHCSSP